MDRVLRLAAVAQDRGRQPVARIEPLVGQLPERQHPLLLAVPHARRYPARADSRQRALLCFHTCQTVQGIAITGRIGGWSLPRIAQALMGNVRVALDVPLGTTVSGGR